ncbi:MAG: ATP-dependent 6-phosphofructokinase [Cyanobacteria bacterium P01_E01_bin.6]
MCKKIGVLTSGGDCPGLNAVIRSVVKCASYRGWEVYGIPRGTDGLMAVYQGLCQPEDLLLHKHGFNIPGILQGLDILQFLSGSVLGSLSRGNPSQPEISQQIIGGYKRLELDALIVIGGDGSFDIIYDLAHRGNWNLIAIPKTIDNDVPFTERSIGFDTAVSTVTNALYDLTFTAASHDRVMVVQVMGRDAGHLSLYAGIAGGADVILIPELVPTIHEGILHQICSRIAKLRQKGRRFALVVVSEGVKNRDGRKERYIGDYLSDRIREHSLVLCSTGHDKYCDMNQVDTRATTLGHIQRSGVPTSVDRLLAAAFGSKAIDVIAENQHNQLIIWKGSQVQAIPLADVIPEIRQCHRENRCPAPVKHDDYMVSVAQSLGIYTGNERFHFSDQRESCWAEPSNVNAEAVHA